METALALFNAGSNKPADQMAIVVDPNNNQQEEEQYHRIIAGIAKATLVNKFTLKRYYTDFVEIAEHAQSNVKKPNNSLFICKNVFNRQLVVVKIKGVDDNDPNKMELYNHTKFELYFCEKLCNRGHPNIIKTFNYWIVDSVFKVYIEMEKCDRSLASYMYERDYKIEIPSAVKIIKQVVEGLYFCHSNNVVHGDIKEHNVLLIFDGNGNISVRLTDFEVSCETSHEGKMNFTDGVNAGCYWPYELLMGSEYLTYAVDMFALGCVFATMICGSIDLIRIVGHQNHLEFLNSHSGPITDALWNKCGNRFNLERPPASAVLGLNTVFYLLASYDPLVSLFIGKLLDLDQDTRMTSFSAKHDPLLYKYQ